MGKPYSIGIALGSGSARGWAHIGVLKALRDMGIEPDVIAGCSVGSMVGATYAAGKIDELEEWVKTLGWRDVFSFLDVNFNGGLIQGRKLFHFFHQYMAGLQIEDLPIPFAALATDLETGREVWLRRGPLATAIRASISLPGLFSPYRTPNGRFLLDGGLVNPVPVSLCKALGADIVIAVNLNNEIVGKHVRNPRKFGVFTANPNSERSISGQVDGEPSEFLQKISQIFGLDEAPPSDDPEPGMVEVVATAINIMQDRVTRSRMAGDPPDVMINPKLAHMGLMDFYRAQEAIDEGQRAVKQVADQLKVLL